MENVKIKNIIAVVLLSCSTPYLYADNHEGGLKTDIGGFIRFDVGAGDRYGDTNANDGLGISKAAVAIKPSYKNVQGIFVLGTEVMTYNNETTGNIDIKDAFLVTTIGSIDITTGAAPLFFGLKPEGYPGDRSIQGSVEYGARGAFKSSNQAGPNAALQWNATATESIRLGVFDQPAPVVVPPTVPATTGSGLIDNALIQVRSTNIASTGLYANLGFERLYIAGLDESKNIIAAGAGWKNNMIDVSAEFVSLAKEVVKTTDNESYLIAEATFMPSARSKVYLDYSMASKMKIMTIRAGANYNYDEHTMFTLEYAYDDVKTDTQAAIATGSLNSVDARITFSY